MTFSCFTSFLGILPLLLCPLVLFPGHVLVCLLVGPEPPPVRGSEGAVLDVAGEGLVLLDPGVIRYSPLMPQYIVANQGRFHQFQS